LAEGESVHTIAERILPVIESFQALQAPQGGTWPTREQMIDEAKHDDSDKYFGWLNCYDWLSQYRPQVSQVSDEVQAFKKVAASAKKLVDGYDPHAPTLSHSEIIDLDYALIALDKVRGDNE